MEVRDLELGTWKFVTWTLEPGDLEPGQLARPEVRGGGRGIALALTLTEDHLDWRASVINIHFLTSNGIHGYFE